MSYGSITRHGGAGATRQWAPRSGGAGATRQWTPRVKEHVK